MGILWPQRGTKIHKNCCFLVSWAAQRDSFILSFAGCLASGHCLVGGNCDHAFNVVCVSWARCAASRSDVK